MTLAELIPGLKGHGSRRAVDKVPELRDENRKLLTRQMAADDYFAILTHDRNEVYEAWGAAEEKASQMRMERDAAIEERNEWRDRALALQARFGPQLAAEANANRIDVPPMVRDTTAMEDQATGPIDVSALWEARDAGLLGPVTNPGHTTAA